MDSSPDATEPLTHEETFQLLEQQFEHFRYIQRQVQSLVRTIVTSLTILTALSLTDLVKIRSIVSGPLGNVPLSPIASKSIAELIKEESIGMSLLLALLAGTFVLSSLYHIWEIQSNISMKPALGSERVLAKPSQKLLSQGFRAEWVSYNNSELFRAKNHLQSARANLGYAILSSGGAIGVYLLAISGDTSLLFWGFPFTIYIPYIFFHP